MYIQTAMSQCAPPPHTLSQSCLKVHGGNPIALCIFVDPLVLRISCLVIRELLNALFLNPESSILKP